MKNYKYIAPILLIALYMGTCYGYVTDRKQIIEEYNMYLELARDYAEQGIQVDAESNYMLAYKLMSSEELGKEIGNYYSEESILNKTEQWGETLIGEYPKSSVGYELLLETYIGKENYSKLYQTIEKLDGRNIGSQNIEDIKDTYAYEYFTVGKYDDVGVFDASVAPVMMKELWGYINLVGKTNITPQFGKVGYFTDGIAPVIDKEGEAYFIDANGNKKKVLDIEETVTELGMLTGSVYATQIDDEWSFYNMEDQYIFGSYDEVTAIGNGIGAVKEDDYWQIVDAQGTILNEDQYNKVITDEKGVMYRNERMFVEKDFYINILDGEGETLNSGIYTGADVFRDNTFAAVKKDLNWGYIDKDLNEVIDFEFDEARSFSNAMAAVQKNGKWGYINTDGDIVIDCIYDEAKDFNSSGCAFVKINDEWSLLKLYAYNY